MYIPPWTHALCIGFVVFRVNTGGPPIRGIPPYRSPAYSSPGFVAHAQAWPAAWSRRAPARWDCHNGPWVESLGLVCDHIINLRGWLKSGIGFTSLQDFITGWCFSSAKSKVHRLPGFALPLRLPVAVGSFQDLAWMALATEFSWNRVVGPKWSQWKTSFWIPWIDLDGKSIYKWMGTEWIRFPIFGQNRAAPSGGRLELRRQPPWAMFLITLRSSWLAGKSTICRWFSQL